jgi:tyrosyl-DNA phosphodiesterase-1
MLNVSELKAFDYSSAQAIIIPSVPGTHRGQDMYKYGHMKIRRLLEKTDIPNEFAKSPVRARLFVHSIIIIDSVCVHR